MAFPFKKTAVAAVAAVSLGSAFTTPASAWCNGWGCGGGVPAGAVAAGVIGGMALGAAAASAARPAYAAPVYDGGCWMERRPVYDAYGNYMGRRRVQVCE